MTYTYKCVVCLVGVIREDIDEFWTCSDECQRVLEKSIVDYVCSRGHVTKMNLRGWGMWDQGEWVEQPAPDSWTCPKPFEDNICGLSARRNACD